MGLKTETQKLADEWKNTDQLLKDEILRVATLCGKEIREVAGLIPKSLIDQTAKTLLSALPSLMMGKSIEDIVVEAASAIPELSPYVRQLLGE